MLRRIAICSSLSEPPLSVLLRFEEQLLDRLGPAPNGSAVNVPVVEPVEGLRCAVLGPATPTTAAINV